jgi:hypothetical protein
MGDQPKKKSSKNPIDPRGDFFGSSIRGLLASKVEERVPLAWEGVLLPSQEHSNSKS